MADNDLDTSSEAKRPAAAAEAGDAANPVDRVKRSASEAYETARQRTADLYSGAREGAVRARRRSAEEIDANPVAALAGGLAFGAILAALLPRTRRENAALGALGGRINDSAREAVFAARDAGREKLDELGLSREGVRQKLADIASTAGTAMKVAGSKRGKAR